MAAAGNHEATSEVNMMYSMRERLTMRGQDDLRNQVGPDKSSISSVNSNNLQDTDSGITMEEDISR